MNKEKFLKNKYFKKIKNNIILKKKKNIIKNNFNKKIIK